MFESPRPAAAPASQGNYIQPVLGDGLRIWWAFWWPVTLLAIGLTIGVNLLLRLAWENTSVPAWLVGPIMKYDAYFFTYAVAFFIMWYVLHKNFRHFRIGLLSNHGGEGAETLPVTPRRVARVWWTYSWRSFLYRVIVLFVVSFPLSSIVGFVVAIFKLGPAFSALVGFLEGAAVDAAAGLFVIYSNILDEDISDFRVALLPPRATAVFSAPAAPPNLVGG